MGKFRENRLNGLFPLSYTGVIPVSPVNFVEDTRPPTSADAKNFYIGDMWLDITSDQAPAYIPPSINNLWILVSLDKGIATWIPFGSTGGLLTLTGNTGGAVSPNMGNINVIGDTTVGLTVAGNPATHTLTITTTGGHVIGQSITGNVGGAVFFDAAGNIDLVGAGGVVVTGNPGTNTLTITSSATGIQTLTGNSGGPVGPDGLGNVNIVGSSLVQVAGNPGTNTLTLNVSGAVASQFTGNVGAAVPVAGNLNIFGNSGVLTTVAGGNTVTVDLTAATDGQLIIGSSIGNPAWATLTAGAGISINNGHNSITIAATGASGSFNKVVMQVFTGNGTYTPTAGMKYCIIEVQGGGGGGGGTSATGATTSAAAGGGAGGGYSRGVFDAATIGVSQAVTVGAGGAGGAAGGGGNPGSAGGTSSVGALISATGGGGSFGGFAISGPISSIGANTPGGGSGGSVNVTGGCGQNAFSIASSTDVKFLAFPGKGGNSYFAGGGGAGSAGSATPSPTSINGLNGNPYGGGGGGACGFFGGAGASGGNGAAGVVIITEFISI